MIINISIFHIQKIEAIGKRAPLLPKVNLTNQISYLKIFFQANPPIDSGYHFGSRLVIKDKHLYVSAGERGKGMIAQDAKNILVV